MKPRKMGGRSDTAIETTFREAFRAGDRLRFLSPVGVIRYLSPESLRHNVLFWWRHEYHPLQPIILSD